MSDAEIAGLSLENEASESSCEDFYFALYKFIVITNVKKCKRTKCVKLRVMTIVLTYVNRYIKILIVFLIKLNHKSNNITAKQEHILITTENRKVTKSFLTTIILLNFG